MLRFCVWVCVCARARACVCVCVWFHDLLVLIWPSQLTNWALTANIHSITMYGEMFSVTFAVSTITSTVTMHSAVFTVRLAVLTITDTVTKRSEVFTVTRDVSDQYYHCHSVYCHIWCWRSLVLSLCTTKCLLLRLILAITSTVTMYSEVFTITFDVYNH